MKAEEIVEAAQQLTAEKNTFNLQGDGFFINLTRQNDGAVIARHNSNASELFTILDVAGQQAFEVDDMRAWGLRCRKMRLP